jgi:hypothetical protein
MLRRRALYRIGTAGVLVMLGAAAPRAERPAPLAAFEFLLGTWEAVGEGTGATGGFTFAPAVQDRVILRTNYSNTPASVDKPASRHDDLMTIYVDAGIVKADYIDSEGHVIRYAAQTRDGEVRFVSEIKPSEPRYRLTYTKKSADTIDGKFEIAPPGTPEAFAPYLAWTARKVRPPVR